MPGKIKVAKTSNKAQVLGMVNDKSGRLSSNDASNPRLEQRLMDESLVVDHPLEKGKKIGWGEYKTLSKLQATKFRDAGIDYKAQQKTYDDALSKLENFPEEAVARYKEGRDAQVKKTAIQGLDKPASGRVISGGQAVYATGTKGIKLKPKTSMDSDATKVNKAPLTPAQLKAINKKEYSNAEDAYMQERKTAKDYEDLERIDDKWKNKRSKYSKGTSKIKVKK